MSRKLPGASWLEKLSTEGEGKGSEISPLASWKAFLLQGSGLRHFGMRTWRLQGLGRAASEDESALTLFKTSSNSHVLQAKQLKHIQNGSWVDAVTSSSVHPRKRNTDNNWHFCIVWCDSSHVASDGSAAPFYSNFIFLTFQQQHKYKKLISVNNLSIITT